jgi:hypothetical protein
MIFDPFATLVISCYFGLWALSIGKLYTHKRIGSLGANATQPSAKVHPPFVCRITASAKVIAD